MSNVYKYLDLSSQYRNRTLYPNPTDFVVPIYNSGGINPAQNAFQAIDPVTEAAPTVISTLQAGSTTTNIVLNSSSSTIPNFYVNEYLEINGFPSLITSYDAATQTATVQTAFPVAYPIGTTYYIRKQRAILEGTVGASGNSQMTVNLGATASTTDNTYSGTFIEFFSGVDDGQIDLIASYTGATQIAVLAKPLIYTPSSGDIYNILPYSYDGQCPLIYSGTTNFGQPVCYSIELLYLTLPNLTLSSGYGGTPANYPYFYLKLYNEGNRHADKVLYSNNPHSPQALFKIPLGIQLSTETFFTLKDARCIQVAKFKIDQAIHVALTLPNGDPVVFSTADNPSPMPYNPLVQISMTFALRRIDGSLKNE